MVEKKGRPGGRRPRTDTGFDYLRLGKNRSSKIPEAQRAELAERVASRIAHQGEAKEAFRRFVKALLDQNAIPAELLLDMPIPAVRAGKTRLEQIYDACMFLAFPEYRPHVHDKAFGPSSPRSMRLWRALFPKELGVTHAVIRATSFQEAFALACDYACRMTLMGTHRIPTDMTIRVQFIADKGASRMLAIRHAVRDATRKASNRAGRRYSDKDILGARLVAFGKKGEGDYAVFKYSEKKDLRKIRERLGKGRVSSVDFETFPRKDSP